MKLIFISLLLMSILSGCSKKSGTEKDTILPVITISNPAAGGTFTAGELIQINGTITDDKFIAEVHIHVTNTNTGVKLLDVHLYPAGNTTVFSNQSLTAVAGVNYKIQVIATDRSVNQSVSSVEVPCN